MSIGRVKLMAAAVGLVTITTAEVARAQQTPATEQQGAAQAEVADGPLVRVVREATTSLRDVQGAETAGYVLASGCVSGPEEGAMGVHYVNEPLVSDGLLEADKPEALVFEPRNGALHLAAVEYIVIAEQWDAANDHPPVLQGQHFHYVPAPNRSGLPAYYELHVWAWKKNSRGTFADWNPRVSCDTYVPR